MATFLYRLGRAAFRRRLWAALLWTAVLAVVGLGALGAGDAAEDPSGMPGIESQKAFDLINERFPGTEAEGPVPASSSSPRTGGSSPRANIARPSTRW